MLDKKFLIFLGVTALAMILTVIFVEDTTTKVVIVMLISSVVIFQHVRIAKKNKGNMDNPNP